MYKYIMENEKTDLSVPQVAMNISVPPTQSDTQLIQTEQVVELVKTVMTEIDVEKTEIQEAYVNFAEMVMNGGDATAASKEAMVNLLKLKSDLIDKKTRMLEMMMKVYNKENQGPKTIIANQHNDFVDKRKLFKELDDKETKEGKV